MKVKFLKTAAGLYGTFGRGQVAELKDEVANDYIAHGICEEVKASKPSKRAKTTSSRQSKKSEKR